MTYLRAFDHLTLARLMLASTSDQRDPTIGTVLALLDRLLEAATAGGRTGQTIEILLVQALAHRRRGDVAAAQGPLRRALALAEPEGYVRTFVEAGRPMADLLAAVRGPEASYAAVIGAAFHGPARPRVGPRSVDQDLLDPLSARELEVLRLLATDLDGPGIARHLVISVSTIRSHTKAIYAKLGVSTRRAAVRRGEELELLSRRPR